MENKCKSALEKYNAEEFDAAYSELLPLAEKGFPEAESYIGLMYFLGQGVERSIERAVYWLELAVEHGRGDAAHNLGTLYSSCEPEFPVNHKKSREWYLKAREMGFIVADGSWYEGLK